MSNYIKKIALSKGYSEALLEALEKVIPSSILYYGQEYQDLILETLDNTNIYICNEDETVYDALSKVDEISDEETVKKDDLLVASGVVSNVPEIIYKDEEYRIDYVSRYIILRNGDFEKESNIRTLVHEFSHALKSYKNSEYIKGDILYSRNGLIESFYKLSTDETGKVVKKLITEKRVGMEEGFNSLDEREIMNIITGKNTETDSYKALSVIAEESDNLLGLRAIRIKSQLSGNVDLYKSHFNGNSEKDIFEELALDEDKLVEASYEGFKNILLFASPNKEDQEKVKIINEKTKVSFEKCRSHIDEALAFRGIEI